MRKSIRTNDFLLFMVVFIWGAHFAVVKQALVLVAPMSFAVVRFFTVAVLLFCLVRWHEGTLRLDRQDWGPMLLLGAVAGANQILWMCGLERTTSGKSALLVAASPAFVVIMRAVKGERINWRVATSLALALAGVGMIVDARTSMAAGSSQLDGDLLTLGAAVTWAMYANMGPRLLQRCSPLKTTAYVFAVITVMTAIPGLRLAVGTPWARLPATLWLQLGYSALLAGGLAWVLWYRGVAHLGPVKVMLYQYLVPVVALVVSIAWLREPIRWEQVLGAGLVLTCTLVARLSLPGAAAVRPTSQHLD
ncbi:MAG: DMT family transporter [Bacillota bacterium]